LTRLGDRIVAALLLALAVGIFAYTFTFPPTVQPIDPGVTVVPRMVSVLIGVLAVVLFVRPREGERLPRGRAALQVAVTVLLLGLYATVLELLGFVITTVVFLLAELLLLGLRRPVYLITVPLCVGVGLFYLFRVFLDVPLPTSGLGGLPI
jgi:putative tricarboxylic transport membrane protein